MIDALQKAGISVHIVNSFDVQTQIQEMVQCRAILNLHASPEYTIFESARCNLYLDAGMPVITEPSLDDDSRCIVIPRNEFVPRIQDWLERHMGHVERRASISS
jgi:hypothetical protein